MAIVYSLLILIAEFLYGQSYVRNYLTDIKGPVFFFGINTTITTFLLWLIAFIYFLNSCTHLVIPLLGLAVLKFEAMIEIELMIPDESRDLIKQVDDGYAMPQTVQLKKTTQVNEIMYYYS